MLVGYQRLNNTDREKPYRAIDYKGNQEEKKIREERGDSGGFFERKFHQRKFFGWSRVTYMIRLPDEIRVIHIELVSS